MKTMKHFSLFLVLVVLTVSVFSICAFAGTDGSLDWSVSGGTLSITGNGMMDNYTLELLPAWYAQKDAITSVVIESDVESIGSYAFYGLTNLNSITAPSISNIGYGAFEGTALANNEYIQIGDNYLLVEVADKTASSFSFRAGTVAIAEGAFEGCTNLTTIAIPETVVSIGDGAFKGCTADLTLASVPNYLGTAAFGGCSLNTIEENGAIYVKAANGKLILLSANSDDIAGVTVNENTEVIAPLAFDNCKNIAYIELPNSIKYIGNAAFYGCSSLYSVTLPDSIVAVGDLAFANCTALTTVDLKEIVAIGNGAFKGTLLKEVVIPATVESLGYNAFRDCTSLETVGIVNGVKAIGYKTFEGCTALVNVYLPDSLVSVGDYAFMNCTSVKAINLPTTMKSVGFGAFASTNLETITLPFVGENTYIGYAFGAVTAEDNAKVVPETLGTVLASGVTTGVDFDNVIYDASVAETLTASISNASLQMGEMIDLSTITATLNGIDTTGLVRLDSNPVVNPGETTTIKVYVGSRSADVSVTYTDEISFTDYNLLLEGNIGVKVYVQLTPYTVSNISELKATVNFKDNTEVAEIVNAGKADNPNLYYIKYNIAAKEMLENITFTVTTSDAEITKTVTVKEYVDAINGNDDYKDSVALVNAMYDFGEYARKYFIGGDIAPKFDVTTATVAISDSVKAVKSGFVDGIQIYSSSLLFESNTSIRHYFKLTGDGDKAIGDYTFTLDDGSELIPEQKGDYYYVEVSDIPSHKLDKIRMVTVSDGTSTANYFYSPLTYAKIVIDRNLESDFDLVNALKAFYFYFNESKDYYDLMNKVEVTPGENEAPGQIW